MYSLLCLVVCHGALFHAPIQKNINCKCKWWPRQLKLTSSVVSDVKPTIYTFGVIGIFPSQLENHKSERLET